MKFTVFLAVSYCTIIVLVHSQSTESNNSQELLKRASAQLERLAPYRRNNAAEAVLDPGRDPGNNPESPRYNQALALELFEILPEEIRKKFIVDKRSDNDKTIDVVVDSKYTDLMQERIKRSGISGSAGFISGIASAILGGIASASGTASRGSAASLSSGSSSSSGGGGGYPVYGPPDHHAHYGEQTLDGWDLKRAILNTLLQAIKAIGGGVLALKGQLIKGGGFLISAKGRLISGTGDVISAFGKQIASSAVVAHPNPTYNHAGGYGYNTGTVQHVVHEHDSGYDGLPPSHEYNSYDGHSSYAAPSDDANHAGLLIATPTKAETNHDHHHHHHHEEESLDIRKPSADHVSDLNDSFGGPAKGTLESEQHGVVTSDHHDNHLDPLYPPLGQTPHTYPLDPTKELPNYAIHTSTKESLTSPLKVQGVVSLLNTHANDVQIQQSVEYPPLQAVAHYTPSSVTTNTNQFDILKIPLLDHQQHSHYPVTAYQLPKLPAQSDFYNLPSSYGGLSHSQDPLKTPILNTGSAGYWQNQLPYYAATYDVYGHLQRRNSILKRRYAHDFGWRSKGFRPLGRG